MEVFEPCRKPQHITKLPIVNQLTQFLFVLQINEHTSGETPQYEPHNLAEILIENIYEFQDVLIFKDFLNVFSLGNEFSKLVFNFIEPMFKDLGFASKVVSVEPVSVKSYEPVQSNSGADSDSTDTFEENEREVLLS